MLEQELPVGAWDDASTADVNRTLNLQLSEIEMLESMYPNTGEFQLDDPASVPDIQAFLQGKTAYKYLQSRIGFSVYIAANESQVELVCHLPHEYPDITPDVFTRIPHIHRDDHKQLNDDLHDYITTLDRGEICIGSIIQWIQETAGKYIKHSTCDKLTESKLPKFDNSFLRYWIYSHHIFSKFKRKDILNFSDELQLTGFCLPGKPGMICVEGYSRNVEEFWNRIHRMTWKKIAVKEKEEFAVEIDERVKTLRLFTCFEEKNLNCRAGKGREYHMDLGMLFSFLEDLGYGYIFPMFFGVEGRRAVEEEK